MPEGVWKRQGSLKTWRTDRDFKWVKNLSLLVKIAWKLCTGGREAVYTLARPTEGVLSDMAGSRGEATISNQTEKEEKCKISRISVAVLQYRPIIRFVFCAVIWNSFIHPIHSFGLLDVPSISEDGNELSMSLNYWMATFKSVHFHSSRLRVCFLSLQSIFLKAHIKYLCISNICSVILPFQTGIGWQTEPVVSEPVVRLSTGVIT